MNWMITGITRLYGIIADPVAQVKTPEVLNDYFRRNQQDAVLVPLHVGADGLKEAFAAFRCMKNLGGVIVTVPHKTAAAALCDELGPAGQAIGSVNAIRRTGDGRLVGDMFDGTGFVSGLRTQGRDPAGKRVLLVGAGGAASAIAFALAQARVASLTIANRSVSKAEALVTRLRASFPDVALDVGAADPQGYDLVVNATSLGMKESDPLPLDVSRLSPDTIVAEVIMKPETTALLAAARDKGCTIHYGRHMLDEQVRLLAEFITGD
ncbi:MAG TPA: shikimate dehydrogenase [Burkholderiaceae bacterium]|nr:shikimate dehydrogenase [Burkholderiaceae bacterium]